MLKALAKQGIRARSTFKNGLPGALRVTAGLDNENERFLDAFADCPRASSCQERLAMTAAIRTGGEAIVDALLAHGVDTLFGLPGIQNDWLYNALFDARDRIRVIHTRHEQGAAYMALGYALARGDIAVYNVVPGPGFLNTTAALATAYARDAPVLCLTGQIPRAAIGRELGVLHEIPDQLGVLRSLTKWAARINSPGEAPAIIG